MQTVHYSSARQDWTTPPELFAWLDGQFHFALDAAASDDNALCDTYCTEEYSGLERPWINPTFCNPPYKDVAKWIAKAEQERQRGVLSVLLIPARTDTRAWHEYILARPEVEIQWIRGRLKFGGAKNAAPFPSAVVIFHPERA